MSRLTWRNVAAPNFSDSVAALSAAGRLFSSAADIGSTAAHARAGREQLAFETQQAQAKAQRDAAIQAANQRQLQAALSGYNPDDPTSVGRTIAAAPASLVGDAIGYFEQLDASRTGILDRQETVADIAQTRADTAETLADTARTTFDLAIDEQEEAVYGPLSRRVKQGELRNQDDAQTESYINTLADRNAADYATEAALNSSSPESILTQIQGDQTAGRITADQAARRTEAVKNVNPDLFFINPDVAASVSYDEDVQKAQDVIKARRQEFNVSVSGDPLMAYGSMLFDDPAPQDASKRFIDLILERTNENIDTNGKVYENAVGEMQRAITTVRNEFRGAGIPDNIIYSVVASQLESADWRWQDNEDLQIDVSGAINVLKQFDSISERSNLAARMRDMHAEQNELNELDRRFESSFRDLALGQTRQSASLVEQGRKKLNGLHAVLGIGPVTPNPHPASLPGRTIIQSGQTATGQTPISNPGSASAANVDARIEYLQNRKRLNSNQSAELRRLLEQRANR